MTLLELLENTEWPEVEAAFRSQPHYFNFIKASLEEGESLEEEIEKVLIRYRNIFYALQTKVPSNPKSDEDEDIAIVVEDAIYPGDDNVYSDVYGHARKPLPSKHSSFYGEFIKHPHYALDASSWNEWIAYDIDEKSLERYKPARFIVAVLDEITWNGFYDHDDKAAVSEFIGRLERDGVITNDQYEKYWSELYDDGETADFVAETAHRLRTLDISDAIPLEDVRAELGKKVLEEEA